MSCSELFGLEVGCEINTPFFNCIHMNVNHQNSFYKCKSIPSKGGCGILIRTIEL